MNVQDYGNLITRFKERIESHQNWPKTLGIEVEANPVRWMFSKSLRYVDYCGHLTFKPGPNERTEYDTGQELLRGAAVLHELFSDEAGAYDYSIEIVKRSGLLGCVFTATKYYRDEPVDGGKQ